MILLKILSLFARDKKEIQLSKGKCQESDKVSKYTFEENTVVCSKFQQWYQTNDTDFYLLNMIIASNPACFW